MTTSSTLTLTLTLTDLLVLAREEGQEDQHRAQGVHSHRQARKGQRLEAVGSTGLDSTILEHVVAPPAFKCTLVHLRLGLRLRVSVRVNDVGDG